MTDFIKMNRVICHHRWNALGEWVDCFHQLAHLSEVEIHRLAGEPTDTTTRSHGTRLERRAPAKLAAFEWDS